MIDTHNIPKGPAGSRPITKREFALGILRKPIYKGDYSTERYMEQDEEVRFKLINQKSDFNAEFTLVGKPYRKIWLSQLNHVYLDAEELQLSCGVIYFKSGETRILAGMLVNDFLEATEGKKFQVRVIDGLYAIDFWDNRCRALGTAGEVREYILKAFDEDRYEEVEGMTKPMVCYSLIEV